MKNYHITTLSEIDMTENEKMKRGAWDKYQVATNADERVEALLLIINSHYIRSSSRILKANQRNPDFATFASHWLQAQADVGYPPWPRETFEHAVKMYPPPRNGQAIPIGKSYWEPGLAK